VTVPAPTGDREAKRRMREQAHRADALARLRLAQSTVSYAITVLANGASAQEARTAAWETSEELIVLAQALRRLTRVTARERAALARRLGASGASNAEIALRIGVSPHTVWNYRRGRRGDGQPWADA
jgi:DNA-binding CsgD family transcriptional regulator